MTLNNLAVEVVEDEKAAANRAADVLEATIRARPNAVLLLPTGRTPLPLYAELVQRYRQGRVDFAGVRVFNLDEWAGVPSGAPGSYAEFMAEHLFSRVNVRPENCTIPNGMAADLDAECERYEGLIRAAGGIDLAVLGIGGNGHIGFNEPGTPFESRTHVARVTPETRDANRWGFADGRVPELAMTVGIATILDSREILLMATGEGKRQILAQALDGPIDPAVPASVLRLHPRVRIIADAAAARLVAESAW